MQITPKRYARPVGLTTRPAGLKPVGRDVPGRASGSTV